MAEEKDTINYDTCWKTWEDMKVFGPSSRHTRRVILDVIKGLPFTSVIDVGCGSGILLREIKKRHPAVTCYGSDISSQAVAIAEKSFPGGIYFINDIAASPLPVRADLVLSCDVLEHIEDYRSALTHMYQMTGSYLLITTIQGEMRETEKNVGHVRNFRKGDLIRDLDKAGFDTVKVVEWGFPFYSPLYRSFLAIRGMEERTCGTYGPLKKLAAELLYLLFFLNSSRKGDYLVILVKKREG